MPSGREVEDRARCSVLDGTTARPERSRNAREDIPAQPEDEARASRIKGDPADVEGHASRVKFDPAAPAEVEAHMPLRIRRGEEPGETERERPPVDDADVEAHRVHRR